MRSEDWEQATITVPGLAAPAEIIVDRWGIPHLRAESLDDLFFLQGYNAARDRLWQIDLWRKRGLGRLAASFGPGYLAQDRAARLFLYRGDMDAEWAAYGPDAQGICAAFARGINAYIAALGTDAAALPVEFQITGSRPELWSAADVVRIRSHALMRNALSEVVRAKVVTAAGAAADLLRQDLDPPRTPDNPAACMLAALPDDILDVFKLAVAPVTFADARLAAGLDDAPVWRNVGATGEVLRASRGEGSNNWAVHGSRTATGRPILANDPHRPHAIPSLRYLVHLTAPGFDAIGAGEPCLPGISLGHNGTIAFAITNFTGMDQEDVYLYETASADPLSYRYGDGWEKMRTLNEMIAVRGAADQPVTLHFTRHGPVIHQDQQNRRACAVRTMWSEPGTAPYVASLRSMRARDLPEFRTAMEHWGVPAANHVYADAAGTIAWFPAGFSPVRPNWDGLMPVPGDGSHEWAGMLTASDMPIVVNPAEGYIATANEQNLPADWPHAEMPIGSEWLDRSRITRIREVLDAELHHDVTGSQMLQTDILSVPARRLTRLVAALPAGGAAAAGQALFADWDCRIAAGSAAAALFEVWWSRFLRPGLIAALVSDASLHLLMLPGDAETALRMVEQPDTRLGNPPEMHRDALLTSTLHRAWEHCTRLMGADAAGWRWGDLHRADFVHTLTATTAGKGASLDVGPFPIGGSDATPANALYGATDFGVVIGASVRMVVDVGGWDNSVCINTPGQSGNARSPHHADLAPIWAQGGYVPMLYSRQAVDAQASLTLTLLPSADNHTGHREDTGQ